MPHINLYQVASAGGSGVSADYVARAFGMATPTAGDYWRPAPSNLSTQIQTVDRLLLAPYPVPRAFTMDAFVAAWTTAAGAGGLADFALYRGHATTGLPDALVASVTGVVTTGANVDLVQTITGVPLTADLYWIGCVAHVASPVFRTYGNANGPVPMWNPAASVPIGGTLIKSGYIQNAVAGAPPATFTGTATDRFVPAVFARSA